ncbi:MAG TPA: hypothetical protein VHG93_20010 [Longimicrobium sp.]|nr:hypothetical protein [Longimicrobium sp.]
MLALLLATALLVRSERMEWAEFCAVFAVSAGAGVVGYRSFLPGWTRRGKHPRDLRLMTVSGAVLLWFAGLAVWLEVPAGIAAVGFLVLELILALRYRRRGFVPDSGTRLQVPAEEEGAEG